MVYMEYDFGNILNINEQEINIRSRICNISDNATCHISGHVSRPHFRESPHTFAVFVDSQRYSLKPWFSCMAENVLHLLMFQFTLKS